MQVYTGADGSFTLYEDSGTDYGYEQGAYSRIPFVYDEEQGTLRIGARSGAYDGMPRTRIFSVRWITPGVAGISQFDLQSDQAIEYTGTEVVARRPAAP